MNILGTAATIFTTKADLRAAVQAYDANPTDAIATYGAIAGWDVSAITDMSDLFNNLKDFDADISNWDTSKVTDMSGMFYVRCSPRASPLLSAVAALSPARCVQAAQPRFLAASRLPARAARPAPCALLATLGSKRTPSTSP